MPDRHRRRAGSARITGRRRSRYLAGRIGTSLRESRIALRLTQAEASAEAGVSQGYWSAIERGLGATASLETLASCAAAVDAELAAFIQAQPGSDLPRDIAHLRGQATIVRFAEPGGWKARVEETIDPLARRSRSIDVHLERVVRKEIAVVELVDLFADGGEAMRGLSDKVAAIRRLNPGWAVAGVLALRATARYRALVGDLEAVIRARFPARPTDWISALRDADRSMPAADGFIWVRVDGSGLFAARRRG